MSEEENDITRRSLRLRKRRRNKAPWRRRLERPLLRLMVYLNRIKLPGFAGVGLYDVARFFIDGLQDRNFTLNAAAMAYRFFFALFPGIIFLLTLIPYLNIPNLEEQVIAYLGQAIPQQVVDLLKNVIEQVLNQEQAGLLSFNLLLVIFSTLGGIRAMMYAFSKHDSKVFRHRNFLAVYGVAFLIFIVLTFVFLLSLGIWVYADILLIDLQESGAFTTEWAVWIYRAVQYTLLLICFFFAISFIYYVAPETQKRWSFINPGSLIAGFLTLAAMYGLRLFIANFTNFNKFYGSLSAIIVLMFWFYWISIVLLIGFELNAAIAMAKEEQKKGITAS